LLEYGNIMKGSLIANIQITKQVVMINNHNDVHEIIFFPTIKPCFMDDVQKLTNLDHGVIN
jgi:hypothetical protein